MKTKIVTYQNLELGDRYIANKSGDIYDTQINKYVKFNIPSHGYYTCTLRDIHDIPHSLLVHRVIADTWIQNVSGMDVHHRNHDRLDPSVENLEVLSINEHRTSHNRGENNSTALLTEENIHQICKYLMSGYTHKKIAKLMSAETGNNITIDSIDKIASGKNWTYITDQYDLHVATRETMGEFSDRAALIGKLRVEYNMSNREIAARLNVSNQGKQFVRLIKCIPRYADNYRNGKYDTNIDTDYCLRAHYTKISRRRR